MRAISRNRTWLALTPTVLQLQSGAQGWDAKALLLVAFAAGQASRRTGTSWEPRSPLPEGAEEEAQQRHEVVLKHPAAKAMGPPVTGGCTGPCRAGRAATPARGRPRSGLLRVDRRLWA